MPRTVRPYIFLSRMTSNCVHSFSSASLRSSKGRASFALKPSCDLSESRDTPATTAPARRKAACASRKAAVSVVQPGVLSLG